MKKLLFFIVFCIGAVFFTLWVGAQQDVNLMSDYRNLPWEGHTLYYEEDYGTLSFGGSGGAASVTFPTENSLGLWFYCDMGNYTNKGAGYIVFEYLDGAGDAIKSFTSEKNSGNGSFRRYRIGSAEEYDKIPDGAESVRITVCFSDGEKSPYFKNFSLVLSNTRSVSEAEDWAVSGDLQTVQVGVTRNDHIIWTVLVVLAALSMFAVRKWIDKIKGKK